jgi:hypothetical protein
MASWAHLLKGLFIIRLDRDVRRELVDESEVSRCMLMLEDRGSGPDTPARQRDGLATGRRSALFTDLERPFRGWLWRMIDSCLVVGFSYLWLFF